MKKEQLEPYINSAYQQLVWLQENNAGDFIKHLEYSFLPINFSNIADNIKTTNGKCAQCAIMKIDLFDVKMLEGNKPINIFTNRFGKGENWLIVRRAMFSENSDQLLSLPALMALSQWNLERAFNFANDKEQWSEKGMIVSRGLDVQGMKNILNYIKTTYNKYKI